MSDHTINAEDGVIPQPAAPCCDCCDHPLEHLIRYALAHDLHRPNGVGPSLRQLLEEGLETWKDDGRVF